MEEFNLRIFLMVTHSVTGALPLGIIVTSDVKTQTLIDALSLFKSSLPDYAFFGSSPDIGPKVIMTDNCLELRDSLHHAWPHVTLTLCIFHILQQIWRWLYDKNHSINLADRPHMILLVKCVMYALNEDDMIAKYDNLCNDSCVQKYPNFMKYFENLYEDRESWALAYRNDLPLRGNNTNNFCESQFLVLKDEMLNRQKEVNVVGLIDKFVDDFDMHYKNKLLSVASGKFEGNYSQRFKGFGKKVSSGIGFQVPSEQHQSQWVKEVICLGENTYQVSSLSKTGTKYVVDMNSGFCECQTGVNGSPCKHQYILWCKKVAPCLNFLPIFSQEQRQRYAEIAIGSSMPLHYYEGLHDRILEANKIPAIVSPSKCPETEAHDIIPNERRQVMRDRSNLPDLISIEDAEKSISDAMTSLKAKLKCNDQNFLRGVVKFSQRMKTMPVSRLTSVFHTFGTLGVNSKRITATSIVKHSKRGKIHVQPEAVKRGKLTAGGRAKQAKGQNVKSNAFKRITGKPKRAHQFAENVRHNEPVSKKAGRSMATKTRIYER